MEQGSENPTEENRLLIVFYGWDEIRELAFFSSEPASLPALTGSALREAISYMGDGWDDEITRIEVVSLPLDAFVYREHWREESLVTIDVRSAWEKDDSVLLKQGEVTAIGDGLDAEMRFRVGAMVAEVNLLHANELGVAVP